MSLVARMAPIYAVTYSIQHNVCSLISLRDLPRSSATFARHRLRAGIFNAAERDQKLALRQRDIPGQGLRAYRSGLRQKLLGVIKSGLYCRTRITNSSSSPLSAPSEPFWKDTKK